VDVQVHPPQQQQEPGASTTVLLAAHVVPTFELKLSIPSPPIGMSTEPDPQGAADLP